MTEENRNCDAVANSYETEISALKVFFPIRLSEFIKSVNDASKLAEQVFINSRPRTVSDEIDLLYTKQVCLVCILLLVDRFTDSQDDTVAGLMQIYSMFNQTKECSPFDIFVIKRVLNINTDIQEAEFLQNVSSYTQIYYYDISADKIAELKKRGAYTNCRAAQIYHELLTFSKWATKIGGRIGLTTLLELTHNREKRVNLLAYMFQQRSTAIKTSI